MKREAPSLFGNCCSAKFSKFSSAAKMAFISVVAIASISPVTSELISLNCATNPPAQCNDSMSCCCMFLV